MASSKKIILHEGKVLNVKFGEIRELEVKEFLGSGGYAEAWKVMNIKDSQNYVLKHMVIKETVGKAEEKVLIQRIKNESSIKCHSKYIVECYGLDEIEKANYAILFKYIPGSMDLRDWINENKKLSWKDKRKLFIKILHGVNDAHSLNIIHRDIKPENILITKDNNPKIIDFGFAKFKDSSISLSGEMKGTFPYMDPFVILNGIKYVDSRCDIYALGVVLYEMVMNMNFWISNGIELTEFVRQINSENKKNIMEVDTEYNFKEEPSLKKIIEMTTMFDHKSRIKTVDHFIELMGDKPRIHPVISIDSEISTPFLVVEDGSAKGAMYPIVVKDGDERQLGRSNLDATNNSISRKHAIISRIGNKYYLHDTASRNGTFYNGFRIGKGKKDKIEIDHTNRIRFADLWTRFVFLKE